MTIDERLDRLTERHQALAESLELLAASTRKNSDDINVLTQSMIELVSVVRGHEKRINNLETN